MSLQKIASREMDEVVCAFEAVVAALADSDDSGGIGALGLADRFLARHAEMARCVNPQSDLLIFDLEQRHDDARTDRERLPARQLVRGLKGATVVRPTEHSSARQHAHGLVIDISRADKNVLADQHQLIDAASYADHRIHSRPTT